MMFSEMLDTDVSFIESLILKSLSGHQTNEYYFKLMAFNDTEAAWEVLNTLLLSPNITVRYFSANMLYSKVKREINSLPIEIVNSLYGIIINRIISNPPTESTLFSMTLPFMKRLVSIISLLAIRNIPSIVNEFISTGLSMSNQSQNHLIGILLLTSFPQEIFALDVSYFVREELKSAMILHQTEVLQLIEKFSSIHSKKMILLQLLGSWVRMPVGIPLNYIANSHPEVFSLAISVFQSSDTQAISEVCNMFIDIINVGDHEKYYFAMVGAISSLLTENIFNALQGIDDDLKTDLCNFATVFVRSNIDRLSSPDSEIIEIFNFLRVCLSVKPRSISSITFDVWLALQDMPTASRHPLFDNYFYEAIFKTIINQCVQPLKFEDWNDLTPCNDEDVDEFLSYRNESDEVLQMCFYCLKDSYFQCLFTLLNSRPHNLDNSLKLTEVVLFSICSVREQLPVFCSSNTELPTMLYSLLQEILTIPVHIIISNFVFQTTVANFFKSVSFLFSREHSWLNSFQPSIELLLQLVIYQQPLKQLSSTSNSISLNHVDKSLGHTFMIICQQNSSLFNLLNQNSQQSHALLRTIIYYTTSKFLENANSLQNIKIVIETISRLILLLPLSISKELISQLSNPIYEKLKDELSGSPTLNLNDNKVVPHYLQYLCSIFGVMSGSAIVTEEIIAILSIVEKFEICNSNILILKATYDLWTIAAEFYFVHYFQYFTRFRRFVQFSKSFNSHELDISVLKCVDATYRGCIQYRSVDTVEPLLQCRLIMHDITQLYIYSTDIDVIVALLTSINTYVILDPSIFELSEGINLLQWTLSCLVTVNETDALRQVFKFFSYIYSKSSLSIVGRRIGNDLTEAIFQLIKRNVPSVLASSLVDLLYNVVSNNYDYDSKNWIIRAVTANLIDLITQSFLQSYVEAIFCYIETDRRKFKLLLMESIKLCSKTCDISTILSILQ